jgi:hypothetical protein
MGILSYNKVIDLFNDPYYSVSLQLDGNSYEMSFLWNERTKRFHATLTKQNGVEIFAGIQVNMLTDFPAVSIAKENGLTGSFILCPLDPAFVESDETYRSWADYFVLMYKIRVPK